ncbi:MAG TPA: permease [Acidobacteriota bacterium]|nr:permease [Acidobacteriota bacterium]
MVLLAASIVALFLGPLLYPHLSRRREMRAVLDGFIFVTISGLVLLSVLPELIASGGWIVVLFAAVGLMGPTLLEHLSHRIQHETHLAAIILGLVGLGLHAMADGAALMEASHDESFSLLALAVVLHRFPVGLTIWWLLRPESGLKVRYVVLLLMTAGTVSGFMAADWISSGFSGQGIVWFQAFVAGSLLHVVFHRPHGEAYPEGYEGADVAHRGPVSPRFEGAGALAGVVLLLLLASGTAHAHEASSSPEVFETFYDLALESAPALLLAYLMAGLITAFVPASSIAWTKRGSSASQSLRGMAVGLPIPICSCGVVPLYRTLVRRGAPATAAMAFLVATPELGLDAVLISIPLLGGKMTVARVIAAALAAFLVGWLVGRWTQRQGNSQVPVPSSQSGSQASHSESWASTSSAQVPAASSSQAPLQDSEAQAADSAQEGCTNCGDGENGAGDDCREDSLEDPAALASKPLGERLRYGLRSGTLESVDHTLPWILAGLAVAAFAQPLLSGGWMTSVPATLQILFFALVGMPTYVCASGATPLVAVLLAQGVSPGAALAFLLTGPATNLTTFGVLSSMHGKRASLLFSASMVAISVALGLATNQIIPDIQPPPLGTPHAEWLTLLQEISLAGLMLLAAFSLLRRGARAFAAEVFGSLVRSHSH